MNIKDLTTEQRNPNSLHIDSATPLEIVKIINQEDKKIADAVGTQDKEIAKAIEYASKRYREGGRLIYVGAGTSGRLGILDAVELVRLNDFTEGCLLKPFAKERLNNFSNSFIISFVLISFNCLSNILSLCFFFVALLSFVSS